MTIKLFYNCMPIIRILFIESLKLIFASGAVTLLVRPALATSGAAAHAVRSRHNIVSTPDPIVSKLMDRTSQAWSEKDNLQVESIVTEAYNVLWGQRARSYGNHSNFLPFISQNLLHPELSSASREKLLGLLGMQLDSDQSAKSARASRKTVLNLLTSLASHPEFENLGPEQLRGIGQMLRVIATDPEISEPSTLLSIRVLKQLRKLTVSSDPEIAKKAKRLFEDRTVITKLNAESEEAIIVRVLNDKLEGREEKKRTKIKIGDQEATITQQNELERRVRLHLPIKSVRFDLRSGRPYQLVDIPDIKTAVRLMLDKYFYEEQGRQNTISLRPLGESQLHFHSGSFVKESNTEVATNDAETALRFTTSLDSRLPLGRENDKMTVKYEVSFQREIGIYYDTPNLQLLRQDIALRTKAWHPVDSVQENPATALFIKKTVPETKTRVFTDRIEYQLDLPKSEAQFQADAMTAILEHIGVKNAAALPIQPLVRIDNERYGFDLVWRNGIKIGFVVVDSFTRTVLNPDRDRAVLGEDGSHAQWEIELLPEWRDLYELEKPEFENFFETMERQFRGEVNPTPKYLEGASAKLRHD